MSDPCPVYSTFFSMAGATFAMVFTSIGAAYGTAKSGIGIGGLGTFRPDLVMKALIPIVMAGIISVYGLIVSVIISGSLKPGAGKMTLQGGFIHLGAGLTVGLSGMGAGYAIGIVGDSFVRNLGYTSKLFVGMVLILIFAEVLGLYGLIVALILNTKVSTDCN